MKKILHILLIICIAAGCKDNDHDDDRFDISVNTDLIKFTPIPGGSLISYSIPDDASIYAVRFTYTPESGKPMYVEGTYGNTEATIKGFIDGADNIPVEITYVDFNGRSSPAATVNIKILPSAAKTLFDNLGVYSYWGGFLVEYQGGEDYADGFINVGYIGIDHNNRGTVILKETMVIEPGLNQLPYGNVVGLVDQSKVTAVIWTEDFMGNEVERKEFTVDTYKSVMFDQSSISISGDSNEVPSYHIGIEYLTDGDTKGTRRWAYDDKWQSFCWQTETVYSNEPFVVIDLGTAKTVANVRMYCCLLTSLRWAASSYFYVGRETVDGPARQAPSYVKVYLGNDGNEWIQSGELFNSKEDEENSWWVAPALNEQKMCNTFEELERADPCYVDIFLTGTTNQYRYIKMEFLNVFNNSDQDKFRKPTLMEIEVYGMED